jgi:hypothetical protein
MTLPRLSTPRMLHAKADTRLLLTCFISKEASHVLATVP